MKSPLMYGLLTALGLCNLLLPIFIPKYNLGDAILLSTAIVIGIQALENYRLRTVQIKQIELSITPVLILVTKYGGGSLHDYFRNIGPSFAKNIRIKSKSNFIFSINPDNLGPNEEAQMKTIKDPNDEAVYSFIDSNKFAGPDGTCLIVQFENIENDLFEASFFVKEGRSSLQHQKKIKR